MLTSEEEKVIADLEQEVARLKDEASAKPQRIEVTNADTDEARQAFKDHSDQVIQTLKELKIPDVKIPEIKIPDIPAPQVTVQPPQVHVDAPVVNIPEEVSVKKPTWITDLADQTGINRLIDVVTSLQHMFKGFRLPQSPEEAIPVRLVDKTGKTFYDAIAAVGQQLQRHGINFPGKYSSDGQQYTLSGLAIPAYDTVNLATASTTDTYTFSTAGKTVATVTITYTDSSKATLLSVVKT